jgi:hypothetical protein
MENSALHRDPQPNWTDLGVRSLLDAAAALVWMSRLDKAAKAEHPRVAICCQRKGSLWEEGKTDAALQLEQCCNDLAKTHEIDFLCAYPFRGSHDREAEHILEKIYPEHSGVYS